MNFNEIRFAGRLTRSPETRSTQGGMTVTTFGMASSRRKWRRRDGQDREETCFIDCVSFGKAGEIIGKYLQKGDPLFVAGRLKLNQYEGRDGTKRSRHEIVIEEFQFVGGRSHQRGEQAGQSEAVAALTESETPF